MKKTVCIYHSVDLDGWMSAAIVKHWHETERIKIDTRGYGKIVTQATNLLKEIVFNPIDLIGYNHYESIPDLSSYDKIIVCDITFPKEEMEKLRTTKDLIYIDHHISSFEKLGCSYFKSGDEINGGIFYQGLRSLDFSACELTWKYFFPNQKIPLIVNYLGAYDCFRSKNDRVTLEFQYGAQSCISSPEEAYYHLKQALQDQIHFGWEVEIHEKGKAVYSYLCKDAEKCWEHKEVVRIPYPIEDSQIYGSDLTTVRFACINKKTFNPNCFGIDYLKDGYDGVASYVFEDGYWKFSLYTCKDNIDCSKIAQMFPGGGGHKQASGFRIKELKDFFANE